MMEVEESVHCVSEDVEEADGLFCACTGHRSEVYITEQADFLL